MRFDSHHAERALAENTFRLHKTKFDGPIHKRKTAHKSPAAASEGCENRRQAEGCQEDSSAATENRG
jgi:hypothetical protein